MKIDRRLMEPSAALRMVSSGLVKGHRDGERRSIYRGRGIEFADFRPYAPGDDLRVVDWNVYGRLGQMVVRLFHEDRVLGVRVALDCSASMGTSENEKANYGANLALLLSLVALHHRDPVELVMAGGRRARSPMNGHDVRAIPSFIACVEGTEVSGDKALETSLKGLQVRRPKDVIFAISDGLWSAEQRMQSLRAIAGSGHRSVFLHVLGAAELSPSFEHGQLLEDAETGSRLRVSWNAADQRRYATELKKWCSGLERDCGRLGVSYVPCWTTVPLLDVLAQRTIAGGQE